MEQGSPSAHRVAEEYPAVGILSGYSVDVLNGSISMTINLIFRAVPRQVGTIPWAGTRTECLQRHEIAATTGEPMEGKDAVLPNQGL